MSLPQSFWDRLPHRTDTELFEMITHQADYLPEALSAIKAEWMRRNLPLEAIAEIVDVAKDRTGEVAAKARESLGWFTFARCFLFGFTLLPVFVMGYYRTHGYRRKAMQTGWAMVFGVIFFIAFNLFKNRDFSPG